MTLTNPETQRVLRRRGGLSQADRAAELNMSVSMYRRWEDTGGKRAKIGKLLEHERFFILRRRRCKPQSEVAGEIGCSLVWLRQMERGTAPIKLLKEYWSGS